MHTLILASSLCAVAAASAATAPSSVKVSEFGYDEADSTRFLQAAMDSGAKRIVIDARRWVSLPLNCRGDQKIFFEDGAVVEAKKGAFRHRRNDQLFKVHNCTNLVIGGKGEVRMHYSDYLNEPYEKSEFRHCFSIKDSVNVRIWGLKILRGGGDGVYVGGKPVKGALDGGCRNIVLQDLYIDTHVRQGMSVTFCDGLLVERCSFLNTKGLPPSAGIDFEPNSGYNRMRNIVLRDCVIGGNAGQGVSLTLGRIYQETTPTYDIAFERCHFKKDNVGGGGYGGRVTFSECIFEDPKVMPLGISGGPFSPPDCKVTRCVLRENGKDTPMDAAWLRKHATMLSGEKDIVSSQPAVDFGGLKVYDPEPGRMRRFFGRLGVRFRHSFSVVVYADSSRRLKMKIQPPKISTKKRKSPRPQVLVTSLEGSAKVAQFDLPANGLIEFDAPKRGFYSIRADLRKATMPLFASNCPIAIDLIRSEQPLIQTSGDFLFFVPEGTDRFEVMVGGAGRECCGASVLDPDGDAAWSSSCISAWCGHLQRGPAKPGMWKLSVGRADRGRFEDMGISLTGIPALLFPDTERHWK